MKAAIKITTTIKHINVILQYKKAIMLYVIIFIITL